MAILHIFLLCVICEITISTRLNINSAACNNYLKKFGTANSVNGVGPTSLAYTGDAAFVTGTANVQVNLRYSDSLYNDATYFGLTQEDGKTLDSTCLDLKLWKFTSSNYSDPLQVTDLPFTATSNLNKKWRYISFTINGTDLETRLVQTQNNYHYIYIGYYAIAYYAAGTTEVQYTFYFQFSVVVKKYIGLGIRTSFTPLSQFETANCTINEGCIATSVSKLNWCRDATCNDNTPPNLYINDQFYLQQIITTSGLQNYFLINTTVYYIANGLNKMTTTVSIDNTVPGKTLLLLTVDIAWNNISVQVTSYLSTTVKGEGSRFLEEITTIYDPINGKSDVIECIKLSSDSCPTCSEQWEANDGIALCFEGFSTLITTLTILFLFII